jgi:MoxR-like ATPase
MELIERGAYLADLREHLAAAAAGNGRLVLVSGEAGIGKTSLVRAFPEEQGRSRSSVASSAQWTSSRITTVGPGRSASRVATNTSCRGP